MVISDLADGLTRGVEDIGARISGAFFEPVIRLGVTGLSRAGKTVFITSFVANLMDRGRMPGLLAARDGRIEAAFLQPQPNDTLPRFDFETHLGALTGPEPHWPESTRSVSELRLSMRVRPSGLLAGMSGPRTVHLDI
ncbi:MAG: YcjX family protein, partial [Pseudomonadota bacterium]